MNDTKRKKRIKILFTIVSLVVIFSMVILTVGSAFMQ